MSPTELIVFAGLPGTGKTTLAQALACRMCSAYLRIDAIEQALLSSGALAAAIGPEGYIVAVALARSNLLVGLSVIADCVNPVADSRDAWRRAAAETRARLIEVEIVCSDAAEHRRRVETRTADLPGHVPPTWRDVLGCEYEAWDRPRIVIDTASGSVEQAFDELLSRIGAPSRG